MKDLYSMKKSLIINIATVLVSLIVTFFIFENLSWYHFGDIPTKVVLIRLIAFFFASECLIIVIFDLLRKKKDNDY